MIKQRIKNFDLILSFDDYEPLNMRVAGLLEKYGLRGTFFIDTMKREARDQIVEISARGHEIGGHTMSHPSDLKALAATELAAELEVCKRHIEIATKKECVSFAYPRGRFNEDVIEAVKRAGFKEARTTHVLQTQINPEVHQFRMPTTIHILDGRKEYKDRPWVVMARFYLEHVLTHGGFFHLWGHAHEIERDNQWDELELFINEIISKR